MAAAGHGAALRRSKGTPPRRRACVSTSIPLRFGCWLAFLLALLAPPCSVPDVGDAALFLQRRRPGTTHGLTAYLCPVEVCCRA